MLMKDITYAFKIIGETKQGDVKSLIKNIGFKMYQHLVAMRFIKEYCPANNTEKLWKITDAGRVQEEFYREPTDLKKKDGRILAGFGV